MGYTVLAPVGDNPKALFVGMKDFPTERVILITPREHMKTALKLKKQLDEFTVPTQIVQIEGGLMENMFAEFGKVVANYELDNLLVNVATGDKMSTCAALSASYANGIRAIGVADDATMVLPIMKLSYYNELSENKMTILRNLDAEKPISIKDLAEKVKMSISLVSYHINGNYKYKGLKEFRLVEVQDKQKNVFVRLSKMGNLLLRGYIQPKCVIEGTC